MRSVMIWVVVMLLNLSAATARADTAQDIQALLHILDYVAVDYPAVVTDGKITNPAEYAEQKEFAEQMSTLAARLPLGDARAALQDKTAMLVQTIARAAPGAEVSALCRALATELIKAYAVPVAPRQPPSEAERVQARQLFQAHCAACHGVQGYGDGPRAASLSPKPANFHGLERFTQRSIYALYSTITLGVNGTAMPAFNALSEAQRWALAFYVGNFVATDAERNSGATLWAQGKHHQAFRELADVTATTPANAQPLGIENTAVLAYLRSRPEALVATFGGAQALWITRNRLGESLEAYHAGQRQAAYDAAVAAYVEGFELLEARLDLADADLRHRAEAAMVSYRNVLKHSASVAEVGQEYQALNQILSQVELRLSEGGNLSASTGAVSAFLVLLREGFEAMLVLAAIIAFLVKAERRDAMPYVHAGWIGALVLGAVTWFAAGRLIQISGADREVTEGVTALLAAAILIYVGYWLHSHAQGQRWKAFINHKLSGALSRGTVGSLVGVAFLAVYREVFETILFYQTLWLQTAEGDHGYLWVGIAVAALSLVALGWALFRFSVRLPIKLFFRVNAALLYVMAVIFAGMGIAALQKAGMLPATHVAFPEVPFLGIYPDAQSLAVQGTLILIAAGWVIYQRRHNARD